MGRAGEERKGSLRRRMVPEVEPREQVLLRGRVGATVYGCRKILRYSPEEILLLCIKEAISIRGEGLYCRAFSAGTVEIKGRLDHVNFLAKEGIVAEYGSKKRGNGGKEA